MYDTLTLFIFSFTSDTKYNRYYIYICVYIYIKNVFFSFDLLQQNFNRNWAQKYATATQKISVFQSVHMKWERFIRTYFSILNLSGLKIYVPYIKRVSSSFKKSLFTYSRKWTFHPAQEKQIFQLLNSVWMRPQMEFAK